VKIVEAEKLEARAVMDCFYNNEVEPALQTWIAIARKDFWPDIAR
jgi:hypothetical protein